MSIFTQKGSLIETGLLFIQRPRKLSGIFFRLIMLRTTRIVIVVAPLIVPREEFGNTIGVYSTSALFHILLPGVGVGKPSCLPPYICFTEATFRCERNQKEKRILEQIKTRQVRWVTQEETSHPEHASIAKLKYRRWSCHILLWVVPKSSY